MAMIKAKLRELRNADVKFISLVDRAATRIPFRVLKRDKESDMGIDLATVVKGEPKPHVVGVIVYAQEEPLREQVRQSIATAGFSTERVQKADEDTVCFLQGEETLVDAQIVRLSDQLLVVAHGLTPPDGPFGEFIKEHGYYPGLDVARQEMEVLVQKAESEEQRQEILRAFGEYTNVLVTLPSACYTANSLVTTVIEKQEQGEVHGLQPHKKKPKTVTVEKDCQDPEKKEKEELMEKAEEKAEVPETKVEDVKKTEETPQPAPEGPNLQTILDAIVGVQTQVTGITQKLEHVVTEQQEQKKVLDAVVQKADTLESKMTTTVTATPNPPDRPTGSSPVTKRDDDPRTGCFDTAFLRRRR